MKIIKMFVTIDYELANKMVSFIKKRPNIPETIENSIVSRQKKYFTDLIVGRKIKLEKYNEIVRKLEKTFYSMIFQPGETVGIICGQCIGEKTTQSSLNNFHSAGLDTGTLSTIDHLQNVINSSKCNKNKESVKLFKLDLYFNKQSNLNELVKNTFHVLDEIKFSNLIVDCRYKKIENEFNYVNSIIENYFSIPKFVNIENFFVLDISLEILYKYRISREMLEKKLYEYKNFCLPYSMLNEDEVYARIYLEYKTGENIFTVMKSINEMKVVGTSGIKSHIFTKDVNGDWFVECLCNNINDILLEGEIFDMSRTVSSSIADIQKIYGILVAQELIIRKCSETLSDIDSSYFKILAMKMTRSGNLEPLTRYTMRFNPSPLAKASFEESFETFLKASKFKEKENFNSISSSIICGKKPRIGTYQCDILVDHSFFTSDKEENSE